MAWRNRSARAEHSKSPHHVRTHAAARRVVRVPILVATVLVSFGAGIGAGALTHQEVPEVTAADELSGQGLGLMTVTPTPSEDPTAAESSEPDGGKDDGGKDGDDEGGSDDTDGKGKDDKGKDDKEPAVDPDERD